MRPAEKWKYIPLVVEEEPDRIWRAERDCPQCGLHLYKTHDPDKQIFCPCGWVWK